MASFLAFPCASRSSRVERTAPQPWSDCGDVTRWPAVLDLAEAKRILAALDREAVQYVLVGSMAMAAQGLVRATRDMDIFVSAPAENVERLRADAETLKLKFGRSED